MLLQQLLNGIVQGGTYALVALGYTLVFGVLEIINLAHGELFTAGALIGFFLVGLGLPLPLAILGAMMGAALLGAVLELTALRLVRRKGAGNLAPLISTIGLGLVLQNLYILVAGADPRSFRAGIGDSVLQLGPIRVTTVQIIVLGVSLLLMAILQFTLTKTRLGRAVRAVSENPETAALLGVNVNAVIMATVMLAGALGGAAGVLVGLSFVSVSPIMGAAYGLKGLSVIILGGLGNVTGAVGGGLLIGIVEALTVYFGGTFGSIYREAIAFAFLFVILVVRPQGLFGQPYAAGKRS
ncbi:MAG TPA: branched-chain amino acid ABC transporter permease [Symbiobacteriaceae bacterium]|nr:branched-chain amino acid ABC transporter permease [Symbiobacteriaceae bacterium]